MRHHAHRREGQVEVVRVLLKAPGMNVRKATNEGKTGAEVAFAPHPLRCPPLFPNWVCRRQHAGTLSQNRGGFHAQCLIPFPLQR